MTKRLIDIDDDALAEAAEILGTTTKKDTVNEALRQTSVSRRRARAFDELIRRGPELFDLDLLADKKNYRR